MLIVEDDDDLRALGRRHLELAGFELLEAAEADRALEVFAAEAPDLVLLDVGLPGRDGFEVCRSIRQLPAGETTPIIVITGLSGPEAAVRAYESGATDFAGKPLNWLVLARRVGLMIEADRDRRRLEVSRAKLREAERVACLGRWRWNPASDAVTWSRETARILQLEGPRRAPLTGFLTSFPESNRRELEAGLRRSREGGETIELELHLARSDGEARIVSFIAQPDPLPGGPVKGFVQDVTDRYRAEQRIRELSNFDLLTGLPNRQLFLEMLTGAVARSRRNRTYNAVLYLDLDRFKKINESFGHPAGDELLTQVSHRLRACLRKSDLVSRGVEEWSGSSVARWGGDKFLVLLSDLDQVGGAAKAAQRVLRQLAVPFEIPGREIFLSASVGISLHPTDGETPEAVLQAAETAMYHAKKLGRQRFKFYSDWMNVTSARELELESDLHRAVSAGELYLRYQPLVHGSTLEVVGLEALARWAHPKLGEISPDEFIPIAEEAGLIEEIGEWVLRTACRQLRTWLDRRMGPLRVSVNLSHRQLRDEDFVRRVEEILRETRLEPGQLEVELTERGVLADDAVSLESLWGLKRLGIRLVVDDFGTGHSALVYLKRLPLDVLKIDRSFVSGVGQNSSDPAIISAVIAMAHRLDLEVVAEGVESEQQLAFLESEQCDYVQGFLFSHPLLPEEFPRKMERRS